MNDDLLDHRMHVGLVSVQPNIVYVPSTVFKDISDEISPLEVIAQVLDMDCLFIIQPWWSLLHGTWIESWIPFCQRLQSRFPRARFVVFCNEIRELQVVERLGLQAVFMPQNALCNEKIFKIKHQTTKVFDAIYNAKLEAWKRHNLAAGVNSLALLYSRYGRGGFSYFDSLQSELPNATFLNGPPTEEHYQSFSFEDVANQLNKARVGLCLSAAEGGMWASIEYLLCGLSIVSTQSLGGRSVFFDDEFCRIVPDEQRAIADAVGLAVQEKVDPQLIRERTLRTMSKYREVFISTIAAEQSRCGRQPTAVADFQELLTDWAGMKHQSLRQLANEYLRRTHSQTLS